jgi:hypothetical protein
MPRARQYLEPVGCKDAGGFLFLEAAWCARRYAAVYWNSRGIMSDPRTTSEASQSEMWTLSPDRKTIRMKLPELPIAGLSKPLRLNLDFDAETVDAILGRLTRLRLQMLPPPEQH